MMARSRFWPLSDPFPVPMRLISQNISAAEKPWGAVTDPSMTVIGDDLAMVLIKSRGFWKPCHDVKTLNGLAAGALDDVIFGAHHDQAACPRVKAMGDFQKICANDIFAIGQRF